MRLRDVYIFVGDTWDWYTSSFTQWIKEFLCKQEGHAIHGPSEYMNYDVCLRCKKYVLKPGRKETGNIE